MTKQEFINKFDKYVVNVKAYNTKDFIYIGRGSKWGNPYKMKNSSEAEREKVVREYYKYLKNTPKLLNSIKELKNKKLGCYCSPKLCHGHVLAWLANKS